MSERIEERVAAILKAPYSRLFVREEDGGYSAWLVEFPGCFSSGESAEEAMANLDEAIELWVSVVLEHGQDVPPPLEHWNESGNLMVRIPTEMHRRAAAQAHREGISLDQWAVEAIAAHAADDRETRRAS